LKISPGTIFEHDCWTHMQPPCKWRDDDPVAAVCDRRFFISAFTERRYSQKP